MKTLQKELYTLEQIEKKMKSYLPRKIKEAELMYYFYGDTI